MNRGEERSERKELLWGWLPAFSADLYPSDKSYYLI